ncbi:MAG: DMP19 family protein [Oscillospiraceae bacterium]|jgi:hypothetical protein|nr:DMP19 family protein [Oscillospiraceae bacterium]
MDYFKDYFEREAAYKKLKPSDIADISDDDLLGAVMTWMIELLDGKWSDEYSIVSAMPKPCMLIWASSSNYNQIHNMGLEAVYLEHNYRQFAEAAAEGYEVIGADKLAVAIRKANERIGQIVKTVMPDGDTYDEKADKLILDAFEEYIDEFENEFYEATRIYDNNRLSAAYIRKHAECFGAQ